MPDVEADAREIWDRTAGRYAQQEWLERRAVRRALDLAAPLPGEAVLDVATGTGIVPRELATRPHPPAEVVGLDRSPKMLAEVGDLPPGWRTVQGEATDLPFPAARFDLVVCSYLLHLLPASDRARVLAEMGRVVRPGGRLVVVTVWSPRAPVRGALRGLARGFAGVFGGLTPLDPRQALRDAGWVPRRDHLLHRGYPSIVVLADHAQAVTDVEVSI